MIFVIFLIKSFILLVVINLAEANSSSQSYFSCSAPQQQCGFTEWNPVCAGPVSDFCDENSVPPQTFPNICWLQSNNCGISATRKFLQF